MIPSFLFFNYNLAILGWGNYYIARNQSESTSNILIKNITQKTGKLVAITKENVLFKLNHIN